LRAAVLSAGAKALSELICSIGSGRRDEPLYCSCGTMMESKGLKSKTILTILGPAFYSRSMFRCPSCKKLRFPGDEELDVVGTTRSPGMRRMMARAGSQSTFKEGCEDIRIYAGIEVSAKDVERVAERIGEDMDVWLEKEREEILQQEIAVKAEKNIPVLYICYDGTGVPMIKNELKDRKGKQPDGSAKTREAKLGCVFTQTTTDENGFPIRDPESTSFVGAIESSENFGWRIFAEAIRREMFDAEQIVILGDGAKWVKNLAELHFSNATQIVDLYHAREHVADLCKILFTSNEKKVLKYRTWWWTNLDEGSIEKIVCKANKHLPEDPDKRKQAEKEIAYLETNKKRMRYADFRAQGFFVGSGIVEAGCKSIIGHRVKQSGMEWSVRGANAIIALRCIMKSNRLEDYWESRRG
jgi:hypothetical protein